MIFVTVGGQTPFDRLVRCVDEWAGSRGRDDIFAQIGSADYSPVHVQWTRYLLPSEFRRKLEQADLVVGHAGMGTILSALEVGVQLLVMPRRADRRETRNDHQIATARYLADRGLVNVANDEKELLLRLDELDRLIVHGRIPPVAPPPLIDCLRQFIESD